MLLIVFIGLVLLFVIGAILFVRAKHSRVAAPEDLWEAEPDRPLNSVPDLAFLDEFLLRWDQFAQGESDLNRSLNRDVRRFNSELAHAIRTEPNRAVPRAIFYSVVQVGGFMPTDSVVGIALKEQFAGSAPPITEVRGKTYYFAGDLYFWWVDNWAVYEQYPLLAEWLGREFARGTVLPAYARARERTARVP